MGVIKVIVQSTQQVYIDIKGCPTEWMVYGAYGNYKIQDDYNSEYRLSGPTKTIDEMLAFLSPVLQQMVDNGSIIKYKFADKIEN